VKIRSLHLNNFRSYFGENNVDFSCDPRKKVTLFHGAMGAGKTKLFGAIQWCLYGVEEYDEPGGAPNKEIVNSVASKESSASGSVVETEVRLIFEDSEKVYIASRKFRCYGGKAEEKAVFTLMVSKANGDCDPVENADLEMYSILPKELRQYFMFDGEKIQNYSKVGHEIEIKRAIKGLLGFDDIEEAMGLLQRIDADYDKTIRDVTSSVELASVIGEIEKIKIIQQGNTEKILAFDEEFQGVQKAIERLSAELAGMEKAKEFIAHQKSLRDHLDGTIEPDIKRKRDDILNNTEQIYLTMLGDIEQGVMDIYNDLKEKGEIPAPIQVEFVKKKLAEKVCICGRSLEKGKDEAAIKQLLSLISKQDSVLEKCIYELPQEVADLKYAMEITKKDIESKIEQIAALETDKSETIRKLTEITEFLKGSDENAIAMREQQKDQLQKGLEAKKVDIDRRKFENQDKEKELQVLKKRRAVLEEQQDETKKYRVFQDYSNGLLSILKRFYEIYEKETREKVRRETQETFQRFMWKKDHYTEVVIQDDYVLDVIDRNKRFAREGLSAGERQCFSLAFVIALARVTEKDAPFIVDTPLGRISRDPEETIDPRVQILKTLPELLNQVILFVTYEEVRKGEPTEAAISKSVGMEYKLEYNKADGCSKILKIR